MSARKLQQEIDKVNKKISEGLAIFNDTYEKLFATELSSQKDKFEADLKKEIKKLQRLRDQVKQWLGDSSIKLDKKVLQDNRTKIEHAMDQFKDLEKISKIKQFSNEGLELLSKSGKIKRFGDMNDAKKQEACEYISDVIERLSEQNEIYEGEIHLFATQLKKAKASNAASIQASLDEMKEKHESVDNHLGKLESVLRSLENEILKPDQIDSIKDDLDYIVESNQDEDFIDYDDFYDVLDLENIEFNAFTKEKEEQERKEAEEAAEASREDSGKEQSAEPQKEKKDDSSKKAKPVSASSSVSTTTTTSAAVTSTGGANTPSKKTPIVAAPPPPLSAGSYSNVLKNALNEASSNGSAATSSSTTTTTITPAAPVPNVYESGKTIAETVAAAAAAANGAPSRTVSSSTTTATSNGAPADTKTTPAPPGLNGASLSRVDTAKSSTASPRAAPATVPAPQSEPVEVFESKTFLDNIPRLSEISQARLNNPLPFKTISGLLQNSLYNCPDSFDAEKPKQYNPRTVHPSSIDYPQEPMLELQAQSLTRKFNDDTLFYCFYYSDDIYNFSRFNAYNELQRRGWVYDENSHQWYQRDVKTKDIKYFDYEETWLIRRRSDGETQA